MADPNLFFEKAQRLREETAALRRWPAYVQQDAQRSRVLAQSALARAQTRLIECQARQQDS